MRNILIALIALVVIGGVAYYFLSKDAGVTVDNTPPPSVETTEPEEETAAPFEVLPPSEEEAREPVEVIGTSVDGADITAYHFGDGETEVVFIGGIHSAFAPGTVAVANELITALEEGDIEVPENLMVTVIPNMNPDADGTSNTLGARLNGNGVDLNRNFDCEWSETGTWRDQEVSGGTAAFSEPETLAIKDYIRKYEPAGAVVYYAQAGGVFSSNCKTGVMDATTNLTNAYAAAAGYDAFEEFDFYEITGDMVNWFAREGIPAISVLLGSYESAEWSKNKAGVEATLTFFAGAE